MNDQHRRGLGHLLDEDQIGLCSDLGGRIGHALQLIIMPEAANRESDFAVADAIFRAFYERATKITIVKTSAQMNGMSGQ
jgi:hypothetical protein